MDDATRLLALMVYKKHTQANAIDFIDHIFVKLPSCIAHV